MFKLLEPFLPVFRLRIPQDLVQNLRCVGVELCPPFPSLGVQIHVGHHLSRSRETLRELLDDLRA